MTRNQPNVHEWGHVVILVQDGRLEIIRWKPTCFHTLFLRSVRPFLYGIPSNPVKYIWCQSVIKATKNIRTITNSHQSLLGIHLLAFKLC